MTAISLARRVPDAPLSPPSTSEEGSRARAGQIRLGDRAAFAELFTDYGERIYNYTYRRTGSWTDAEDLTSEVFLTALKTCAKAPFADAGLLPWLYAVATNVVRNHQRSGRRGVAAISRLGAMPEASLPVDPAAEVVDRLDADARVQAAVQRLAELPQAFQDVFVLITWEGLSYDEVAAALHCPVGTVRSRLSRVRQALRLTDEVSR